MTTLGNTIYFRYCGDVRRIKKWLTVNGYDAPDSEEVIATGDVVYRKGAMTPRRAESPTGRS